jgi:hypothetical protein
LGAGLEGTIDGAGVTRHPPVVPGALVRLGANVAAAASVLAGKAMIGIGLRRPPEGWRRTVGILLRSQSTRFALSAFALRVPRGDITGSDDSHVTRIAQGLVAFLAKEPDAHFCLEWRRPVTLRRRIPFVDLVVLRFAAEGSLEAIDPYLAPGGNSAPPSDIRAQVHRAIVEAYNQTTPLPEIDRPRILAEKVRAALGSPGATTGVQAAEAYAHRLLAACCLSFEHRDLTDSAQRYCPPNFAARRTLGSGHLSCVARPDYHRASVDLWVSAHHVGLDGVPLQDLLERLEREWGVTETVTFPPAAPGQTFAGPHPCHAPGERPVDQLTTFVDLSPILALRQTLNARHAAEIGGNVTLGTLIAWLLSQEPEFPGVRIANTVDVAASSGYERDVDVVSIRPADYATSDAPWGGFVAFSREFNRQIAAARTRTSPVRVGMQTAGLIPAWAHAAVVRANPASLDDAFGTLCVTIVRDARVFVAPMTDLGLSHGFFAIGSATLRSAAGTPVTSVCVKGDAGRISHYPAILQRMIERSARLHAGMAG